jgi:hypothetical protein
MLSIMPSIMDSPQPANRPETSRRRFRPRLTGLLIAAVALPAGAETSRGIDPEAGLPFWAYQDESVEIRLIQRLPDQTRAFFIGRGFTSETANAIAESCVFQSILRNHAPGLDFPEMGIDLADWRLDAGEGPRQIALKEPWDARFAEAGERDAARIAFRWSTFPTEQRFRGGDYNWGMISFGVPPGTRFDLTLTWTLDGDPQSAVLHGVTCAPETDDPAAAARAAGIPES